MTELEYNKRWDMLSLLAKRHHTQDLLGIIAEAYINTKNGEKLTEMLICSLPTSKTDEEIIAQIEALTKE